MNIDSIRNGIVIDHIQAKKGLETSNIELLDENKDCSEWAFTKFKRKSKSHFIEASII